MKRRLLISILIITMSLAAITGGTLAWFSAEADPIENTFTAGTLSITAGEDVSWDEVDDVLYADFPERENWNPGDCDWKKFTITNTGSKTTYVRVAFEDGWYENIASEPPDNWVEWDLTVGGVTLNDPVTKDLGNWVLVDGYYYVGVNPILASGAVLELDVDICLDGELATNDFQGKQYRLKASFEAIQTTHEAAFNEWGVGYVVTYDGTGAVIDEPGWYPVAQNPASDNRWEATVGTDTYYWTRDGFEGGYWTKQ